MKYDLHIHSTISDGKLSREEIIKIAIKKELEFISFTEHNSFESVLSHDEINIINGIEFDSIFKRSFHLLCYFPNYDSGISYLINKYRDNTNDCSNMLIKKINQVFNISFSLEELMHFFNKQFITKRDIIDWLIFNRYAESVSKAADIYTNKKAQSYVPKYSLPFQEVASVIKNIGGYMFLAHPVSLNYDDSELKEFVLLLKENGLDGIEIVNSSKMSLIETKKYKKMAHRYGLLTCGGSDFHDFTKHDIGVDGDESEVLIRKLKK